MVRYTACDNLFAGGGEEQGEDRGDQAGHHQQRGGGLRVAAEAVDLHHTQS